MGNRFTSLRTLPVMFIMDSRAIRCSPGLHPRFHSLLTSPFVTGVSLYKHQECHPTAAFLLAHAMRHDSDLGIVTPEASALAEHVTMVSRFKQPVGKIRSFLRLSTCVKPGLIRCPFLCSYARASQSLGARVPPTC